MNNTLIHSLPLIHSGQAQKEITHNEALLLLDVLINPVAVDVWVSSPPKQAKEGELYVIAEKAENKFEKHQNEIALKLKNSWRFLKPRKWIQVTHDKDGSIYRFDGKSWVKSPMLSSGSQNIEDSMNVKKTSKTKVLKDTQQKEITSTDLIRKDNGEYLKVNHIEETLKLNGEYSETKIKIPSHTMVIAVNIRVIDEIKGAKSFCVGVEEDKAITRYGSNLGAGKDTTNIGLSNYSQTYWNETPIRITAESGKFIAGSVHISIQYMKPHGPWEWE